MTTRAALWAVAIPLIAFVLLTATKPGIFLPDPWLGWVDAWYYVGFAQNLPDTLRHYSQLYQSDRVSVTLPAYIAHRLASPLAANYLLKGVYFVAAIAALFGCVRRDYGIRTASFVSAIAALHSFFVHAIGAGYVDGPGNTYLLCALFLAGLGLRQRSTGAQLAVAFAAGASLAAVVLSQFVFVVILPFLLLYAFALSMQKGDGRRFAVAIGGYGIGFASVAVFVWRLYHHWQVPGYPMVATFRHMRVVSAVNPLVFPNSRQWMLEAIWLVFPGTVAAWSVMRLIAGWRRCETLRQVPAEIGLFVTLAAVWVMLYFVGEAWITFPFYTSFLLSVAFLALAPLVTEHVNVLTPSAFQGLMAAVVMTLLVALQFRIDVIWPVTLLAGALVALGTFGYGRFLIDGRTSIVFLPAFVAAVAVVNAGSADYSAQVRHSYRNRALSDVYGGVSSPLRSSASPDRTYEGVIRTAGALAPHLKPYEFLFWYDRSDPLSMFYRSVTSMFFAWSANELLPENFTRLDANAYDVFQGNLGAGRQLVVLTQDAKLVPEDARFRRLWVEEFRTAGTRFFAYSFWAQSQ